MVIFRKFVKNTEKFVSKKINEVNNRHVLQHSSQDATLVK